MEEKLQQLIEASDNILVTSHISPDTDAVSSSLLISNTLRVNYPDKTINLVLEELPNQSLKFLEGYSTIKNHDLAAFIESEKPNLVIIVDADKYSRCSRNDSDKIMSYIEQEHINTAVIDHHEPPESLGDGVYINTSAPAAVQEVYRILFDSLGLTKPSGYGEATMLGLLSDTLRFKYKNPKHRETFALVSDLIDAGVDIEALENRLEAYTKEQLEVIAHLIANMQVKDGYNYSFMSDSFSSQWLQDNKDPLDLKAGGSIFVNQFIRNITPNNWGFIVSREAVETESNYSVSFRAEGGSRAVSELAKKLGGGGHESAAGAKFHAESVEEAVTKVLSAIENPDHS